MDCEYLWSGNQPYCRYLMDQRHWRPCCDVAEANEYLTRWKADVEQKCILAPAGVLQRRPGRTHGRLRWLRPCSDVPGARRRYGRPKRRS